MANDTKQIPLLPLRGILVFPNMVLHLDVGRERSVNALEQAMIEDNKILLVAQKEAKIDDPTPDDIYTMGTIAQIKQMLKLPGGTIRVLVEGLSRAKVQSLIGEDPYLLAEAEEVAEDDTKSVEIEALMRSVIYQFEQYIKLSKKIPPESLVAVSSVEEPGRLADLIASHLTLRIQQKQEILEAVSPAERLEKLSNILSHEMEILEVERKINLRVRKQMERTQKEYYLREQLKAIQKELGEKDERLAEADEYREKISEAQLPEEVEEKALKEVERLEKMQPAAAEAVVIRTYLDWILALPWTIQTEDRLDLVKAEKILDEDHYGLEKVKERLI